MKKTVLSVIVAIVIIVAVVVGAYFILNGSEEEKTIDLNTASQTLSNSSPFNELSTMDITIDVLSSVYGINTQNVENVIGKMPMMNVQASMYLLIQAKDGTAETVKSELDQYATKYEEQWSTYLPEQYELVKNRLEKEYGDYLIYIVSSNNDLVFETIKANNLS